VSEALVAVRFIHFASAMAVFGTGAFRLYAFAGAGAGDGRPENAAARDALDAFLARAMMWGTVVALLSALAMVPCVGAGMAGTDSAALDPATDATVLFGTSFGQAWCWHIGFAIVLLALCAMPRRRWQSAASLVAALLFLASLGWVGHAAMDFGGGRAHELNQMVRNLAASDRSCDGDVITQMICARDRRPLSFAYGAQTGHLRCDPRRDAQARSPRVDA